MSPQPEPRLEQCRTGRGSATRAIFGDHCYLWGIGREARTTENLEKDRLHGVDEENSIAALRSPGPGTQNHRLPCVCCQAWPWALSAPSLHTSLTVHDSNAGGISHSVFRVCAPGTFSPFGTQNLRLFFLLNATLFCRRGEK